MAGTDSVKSEAALVRLMAARIIAQTRWPYMASLLFALKLVELPAKVLPTMAVDDGWRMYFNADFVLSMEPPQLATIVQHECLHCVMNHADRFKALAHTGITSAQFNICGDCAINKTLDDANFPFPSERGVRFEDFSSSGISPMSSSEANVAALSRWASHQESTSRIDESDCGSAAGGQRRSYEKEPNDADSPAVQTPRRESVRDRVAADIIQTSKDRGNVPGDLLRWARAYLHPQVDWRSTLGAAMRRAIATVAGRKDYSYVYPTRRAHALKQLGSNIVLPSMRQPPPPHIAVIVDTSMSMGNAELQAMVGEIAGIARSVGISSGIQVITCDSQIGEVHKVRSIAQLTSMRLSGGGGTDLRVGLAHSETLRPRPSIVVTLTDGYTYWPESEPNPSTTYIAAILGQDDTVPVPEWMTRVEVPL